MALQFAARHQVPLQASLATDIASNIATTSFFSTIQTSLIPSIPSSTPSSRPEHVNVFLEHTQLPLPSHQEAHKPRPWSLLLKIFPNLCGNLGLDKVFSALLRSHSDHGELTASTSSRKPPSPPYASHNYTASVAGAARLSDSDAESRHIPDYVLEYAPYCHLYSEEEYWPGIMSEHLEHTTPEINYDPVPEEYQGPNLHNLNELNRFKKVYLTSNDDPETYPDWLGGEDNIPEVLKTRQGKRKKRNRSTFNDESQPHRSSAPAVLVVVDKGEFVDAFWFFFYSFNLGNQVLGVRFGNHVGDWEHTAVRFKDGKPIEVFYSEHEWGAAYRWEDAEKYSGNAKRMLTYSAYGTHAMYRTAGIQRYVLPFGLLQDTTDKGPLWDPTLNMYAYTFDPYNDIVRASNLTPDVPEEWFHFRGMWGDKYYPMDDPRQYRFLGELHYDSGPTGPKFKNLGRSHICQNKDSCIIKDAITPEPPRIITAEEWKRWRLQRRNEL